MLSIYLSNAFINQLHVILVTADLQDGNGGGAGGGLDGVVLMTAMSFCTCVSDCTCDKIFLVSLSPTQCTFSPRPSTNFDSCDKQHLNTVIIIYSWDGMHIWK